MKTQLTSLFISDGKLNNLTGTFLADRKRNKPRELCIPLKETVDLSNKLLHPMSYPIRVDCRLVGILELKFASLMGLPRVKKM